MTLAPAPLGGSRWHTFPEHGTLTARRFATAAEPLLQGVIDAGALGPADLPVLDEQIHATLALGTRETALPLTPGPDSPRATRELAAQARAIGREIAAWSTAALRRLLTDPVPLPAGPFVVRSHCYGHLLTPADYDAASRTPLGQLPPHTPATAPRTLTGRVTAGPVHDGVRTARIAVTHDGTTAHADLGQALRGHRFAHRRTPGPTATAPRPVAAWDLLRAPQLVQARDTAGAVDTTGLDGLTVLALLGRSYPRAVVLRPDGLTLGATGRSR
ncbi:hypothetical protein N0X72_03910 [Streptomyces carpaticus]|uniref:hypothetical protein n=1 Tax=Streptomyces carpaticus TaxID=285558 RepID=UPI00220F1026|nr:hypothetical protein N0X72_03910 [Streptomyces carpaticus]